MKTPKWICEECEQTFTRRWNANRHCNNKHGTLDSVILFREYLANKGNNRYLRLSDMYSQNTNQIPYHQNLSFHEKTNSRLETKFKIPLHRIEDYQDREILLNYKLDELAPQYQQLENLLSHVAQPKRASILGPLLNMALNSENPVAFINNQLDEFRRAKTRDRMLDEISAYLGLNKNVTKEYLRISLK
ncbi:MAG TPA: hypothetical protein VF222_02210 [Nitrososphaeraceae archaeon]